MKYFLLILLLFPKPIFAERIKIGMLLPLSGNYAAVGVDNQQGINTALKFSNLKDKFEIIYADSKADPVTSVNEFKRLTEIEKVLAVYAMRGPVGMAVNPLSKNSNISLLGGVGNKDFAISNQYAFQAWSSSEDEGKFLAEAIKSQKVTALAILTTEDDWTVAVSKSLREGLSASGTSVVFDESLTSSESDFRALLAKLKNKKPDAIFLNVGMAQIGSFVRQVKELGLEIPLYSNFWAAKTEVIQAAGIQNMEDLKYVEMNTELEKFKKEINDNFHSVPSGATLSAYLSTLLLGQTLTSTKFPENREEMYSALSSQREIETPDGNFPIIDRYMKFPLVVKVIKNGKSIVFKDR